MILVDFSEAIFVARHNLRELSAAVFVMGDLTALPFRRRFADFAMCVGVLHHLPINALEGVKIIARYAPELLVYLYSALDGRPWLYRQLFRPVDLIRRLTCRIRSEATRRALTWFGLFGLYLPMLVVGYLAKPFGLEKSVPLFEFYSAKSWKRIRQDVYDRFFTSIEQRFSWCQIQTLGTDFDSLVISTGIPRWHFVCRAKD